MNRSTDAGPYQAARLRGRPRHNADAFARRHPAMDLGQRAKIFAPFDALTGFRETVIAKEAAYEPFRELSDDQKAELDRTLDVLQHRIALCRGQNLAPPVIEVEYYTACEDTHHEAYGRLGRYQVYSGPLKRVNVVFAQLTVADRTIDFDDIFDIRLPDE